MSRTFACVSLLSILAPAGAFAAEAAQSDDAHPQEATSIIVTAPYNRDRAAVLAGTSILTGEALTRDVRTTIGDTLTHQPGVSATSFGPNASRPVLRGFQGERIRVLKDGIGSVDVSNTSVDHPVVVNPLTAERIEVLRGPAALLYGSAAIGGVVNVLDNRIPRHVPDHPVHVDATGTYGSAAEERSIFGQADAPVGSNFVVHVDGSYAKSADLDTGNFILSEPLRAQAAASSDPAIRDLATLRGKLPNSAARTWEAAAGAALVLDGGTIGASFSHYDSLYGVPIRFSLDPGVEPERVRLRVKQDRADLRAELHVKGSFIDTIRFRSAFADYKHAEIDDTGAIGTTFLNKSNESRLEIAQAKRGGWQGAFGAQLAIRDFNVIGNEAFVPKNTTQQFGVFTLQEVQVGRVKIEGGARYERTNLTAVASPTIGNADYRRNFAAISGSLGASYEIASGVRLGLTGSHTERAPAAEELFANGPHAGTQAYEIGNPDFVKETSDGLEAALRGSRRGLTFGVAAYYNWFSNYIYDQQSGAIIDDLPVFRNLQADARYWGIEAEASAKLATLGSFAISVDGVGDYTNARLSAWDPSRGFRRCGCSAGLKARRRASTCAPRLNGVRSRIALHSTKPRPTLSRWSTPVRRFVPSVVTARQA